MAHLCKRSNKRISLELDDVCILHRNPIYVNGQIPQEILPVRRLYMVYSDCIGEIQSKILEGLIKATRCHCWGISLRPQNIAISVIAHGNTGSCLIHCWVNSLEFKVSTLISSWNGRSTAYWKIIKLPSMTFEVWSEDHEVQLNKAKAFLYPSLHLRWQIIPGFCGKVCK